MKKAREILIPDDRPLTWDEYQDYSTHAFNSSSWYATEYSRTEQQVRDKLYKKGYPREEVDVVDKQGDSHQFNMVEDTIEKLREGLILDDERIAKSTADRGLSSGKGASAIRMDLMRKGIDSKTIDNVIDELENNEDAVIASVDKVAQRFLRSSACRKIENEWERSQKLTRAILSKGFSYSDIQLWKELQE